METGVVKFWNRVGSQNGGCRWVVKQLVVVKRVPVGFSNGRGYQIGTGGVLKGSQLSKRHRWGFEMVWVVVWLVIGWC